MDEAVIQAQVAQNIPQDEPTTTAPEPSEPSEPATHSHLEFDSNLGLQLSDYFGLDRISRHTESTQVQLRNIFRWAAQKSQATDIESVFNTVRLLEDHLGLTYKPNRLQRLARWIELEEKTAAFRAQQEMIRHG